MRKLRLLLAGTLLTAVGGCAYTAMTSDTNGKVYMTRTNMNGLWNSQWVCEPNGGKLNCTEASFEGTGGGAAAAPAAAADTAGAEPAAPLGNETLGNTQESAIKIALEETPKTVENIKLTKDNGEIWFSHDQHGGNTYYFESIGGAGANIKAVVYGPPGLKVHKTQEDPGDNPNNFTIVYPETKDNPHFLKIWLASGDAWSGTLRYRVAKSTK